MIRLTAWTRTLVNESASKPHFEAEGKPVLLHLNSAAQIILALLVGSAAFLRASAVFLPVWRRGRREKALERPQTDLMPSSPKARQKSLPAK
jgi:hypothetical protein